MELLTQQMICHTAAADPRPSPTFPRKSIFCLCEWIQYKCPSDRNAVAACSVRDVFVVSSLSLSCHWSYMSEGMILLLLYCVLSTFLWILLLVQLQQMQTNLIMMVIGNGSIWCDAKIITSMYFTSMYLCVLTIIFVLIFILSLSLCLSMFQRCQGQSVRIILWHWHQVSPDPGIHLQVTDVMLCPPWLSTFKKFW